MFKFRRKSKTPVTDALQAHYSNYIPERGGAISDLLRRFIFRNIVLSETEKEKITQLDDDGIFVYASKYRSHFSFLYFHTRLKQMGLPFPTIGFECTIYAWQPLGHLLHIMGSQIRYFFRHFAVPDPVESGHIKKQLLNGKTAILPLISRDAFYRSFVKSKTDPIACLLELQAETDRPVYIIPEVMVFSMKPKKSGLSFFDIIFGTRERPGKIRRLAGIFKRSKESFIEFSEPVSLKMWLDAPGMETKPLAEQAILLRRELIEQLNRHRQSITGPVLKSRQEIRESILTGSALKSFMIDHAEETDTPLQDVHKKADTYVEEIAANYSVRWIRIFEMFLDRLFKSLFEGIVTDKKGIAQIKIRSKQSPLVLVPCHKSHLDYLILSYVFKKNNMPCPHIAAGRNLSFWPLGIVLRGGGAFFMRRTFKGAKLYSRVFFEYMYKLLTEGFNVELFIEGTRSRTGKLLSPKVGLLSMLVDACRHGACEDLQFVPVYFGYDRVLEEDAYLHEVEGGSKESENLSQLFKARRFLKRRYGKVYVNFHEPIALSDVIKEKGVDFKAMDKDQHNEFCNDLGYRIINSINDVSIVTPYGVVASAVLNSMKKRFTFEQAREDISLYTAHLDAQKVWLTDSLGENRERSFQSVLDSYVRRKFLECGSDCKGQLDPSTVFNLPEDQRPILDYYKNNCIIHFISAAMTAMAIKEVNRFQFQAGELLESYTFLSDLFDPEFAFSRSVTTEYQVRKDLKAFIDTHTIVPHGSSPDTYEITPDGLRKLTLFSRFLKTYLESYLVALTAFESKKAAKLDTKAMVKKCQSRGKKMFKGNEIELPEALSDITFKNAVRLFTDKGILDEESGEATHSFYKNSIQHYLEVMEK
ncbi:1-acyl-sn-glycerol-3-phosphate acyltransferase [Desulfoluna sp.]|uniref:1-acyl-sn-glycerol-3-phosphate acyltransferase n=1 Tax=Desulfoluna sp. TaxID=2045199 RepID=UPI0026290AC2|nr:1-acyl-sn-glycerol-3-phosphate acyltransferase [Desulfoluna sp.]